MKQNIEKICPTCMCSGREVMTAGHPAVNVYGWTLINWQKHLYERLCKRCNGTGFVPIAKSVPAVSRFNDTGAT